MLKGSQKTPACPEVDSQQGDPRPEEKRGPTRTHEALGFHGQALRTRSGGEDVPHGEERTQADSGLQAEKGFGTNKQRKSCIFPILHGCKGWLWQPNVKFILFLFLTRCLYFSYFLFCYFFKLSLSGSHWFIKSVLGTKILGDRSKRKSETWPRS